MLPIPHNLDELFENLEKQNKEFIYDKEEIRKQDKHVMCELGEDYIRMQKEYRGRMCAGMEVDLSQSEEEIASSPKLVLKMGRNNKEN